MIGRDIEKAKELLEKGEVVAIPTETVYGLAGNALNVDAVLKIFSVKNRPSFDPLIIHVADFDRVNEYVTSIPSVLNDISVVHTPGPITFLLPKKDVIPDLVTSGSPYVAVRIPAHPMCNALLKTLDFPLAAPSANPFGYISPTTAKHVENQLGSKIPYILDGGHASIGIESTIVGIEDGKLTVYRKGGLDIEVLKSWDSNIIIKDYSTSQPMSPGLLSSHYAPNTPIFIGNIEELIKKSEYEKIGALYFNQAPASNKTQVNKILSPANDTYEAARNLFDYLRYLDGRGLDVIYTELVPEVGLGSAINDRLNRAAANNIH